MKKLLLGTLLVLFAGSFAQASEFKGKINKGDKLISASGYLGYSTFSGAVFSLDASEEYFIKDHFALGLVVSLNLSSGTTYGDVGISGRQYFYAEDNSALFGGLSVLYAYSSGGYAIVKPSFGYDYFINSNISFGPMLQWSFYLYNSGGGTTSVYNNGAILANFSLFF